MYVVVPYAYNTRFKLIYVVVNAVELAVQCVVVW